jgi:glutamine phosphoribosylpyrophosphate amidotransferase
MCGIVGYIGNKQAGSVILEGLRGLEYRGYDSAGIAVGSNGNEMQVRRAAGKIVNLEAAVQSDPLARNYGFGHTRWATPGRPLVGHLRLKTCRMPIWLAVSHPNWMNWPRCLNCISTRPSSSPVQHRGMGDPQKLKPAQPA